MDSSRPIILLEEIFEDAHISRAVVVVAQEDHLDKTYTSDSDNGSSSSDDDNEFNIVALAPSPTTPERENQTEIYLQSRSPTHNQPKQFTGVHFAVKTSF